METNAERKPRIIEIMILVIYLFVMPLELKKQHFDGERCKKGPHVCKGITKRKRVNFDCFSKAPKGSR